MRGQTVVELILIVAVVIVVGSVFVKHAQVLFGDLVQIIETRATRIERLAGE